MGVLPQQAGQTSSVLTGGCAVCPRASGLPSLGVFVVFIPFWCLITFCPFSSSSPCESSPSGLGSAAPYYCSS